MSTDPQARAALPSMQRRASRMRRVILAAQALTLVAAVIGLWGLAQLV